MVYSGRYNNDNNTTTASKYIDIDKLTNTERMKIAIRLAKEFRRYNYPDECSLAFIKFFINDLRIEGFTDEEIRYAITRAYTKRIRKYECMEHQYSQSPTRI